MYVTNNSAKNIFFRLKFGINLVKSKEAGKMKFIDGLKLITDHIQDNGLLAINHFTQTFLSALTESIQDNAVIIIDKLSLLQSLGFTTKELLNLTMALQSAHEKFKNCCVITRCKALTDLGELGNHDAQCKIFPNFPLFVKRCSNFMI